MNETTMCIAADRHGEPCDKESYVRAGLCVDHALEVYVEMQSNVSQHMRRLFKLMKEESESARQGPTEYEIQLKQGRAAQSVVYYARIGDYIKIGFTENLQERLAGLRIDKEDIMATEPGGRAKERERHLQFADIRRGKRENFEKTPELLTHIAKVRRENGPPRITRGVYLPPPEPKFSSPRMNRILA